MKSDRLVSNFQHKFGVVESPKRLVSGCLNIGKRNNLIYVKYIRI